MRVTTFGVNGQYMSDLNNIMTKYQNLEQQLSTGRKLNQPSDDPVGFEGDIQDQSQMTQINEWQSNITSAISKMQSVDSTMSVLQNTLSSIRTELVQALNGTNTPSDIGSILSVVKQQVQSFAQVSDTSDGQQYIFGGINGQSEPVKYDSTTTPPLSWTGGTGTNPTPNQTLTIQKGVSIETGVDGYKLLNSPTGSSLIDTLNNIVSHLTTAAASPTQAAMQTAMNSVQGDLSSLDTNIDNVSGMRADLGGRMTRVTSAQTQLQQMSTALQTQKSSIEDANIAQVMTQLTTQQTVYQAALQSGQRMILPTLADTLK